MGKLFRKAKQLIGYILMPESSPEPTSVTCHSIYPIILADRMLGFIKSVIWILAAIGLTLLLGKLD